MTSEDLSVTISLYNKENTIARAIESILNQTELPKEIIIVDDGSTDKSSEIARNFSIKNARVSYLYQQNSGVSVARNRGVAEANTRFVCFLDADDVWKSNYVENLVNLINSASEADFYCLAYETCTEFGTYQPTVAVSDDFKGIVNNPIKNYSEGYGLIHTSAICFRKNFFEKLGGFPEGENFGEDLYMWLKACAEGKLAFYNQISVTLYKEPLNSLNRRKHHPYHLSYFTEHMNDYDLHIQKQLKKFLIKNIIIQWAASKIEGNRWQQNILKSYAYKINTFYGLILKFAEIIPSQMYDMIRKKRIHKRLQK